MIHVIIRRWSCFLPISGQRPRGLRRRVRKAGILVLSFNAGSWFFLLPAGVRLAALSKAFSHSVYVYSMGSKRTLVSVNLLRPYLRVAPHQTQQPHTCCRTSSLYSTATQNTWRRGLEIPTCWYILALPNAKICVNPDANPRHQSVEYRWRWVFWRWPCRFHVYPMLFVHHFQRWLREN